MPKVVEELHSRPPLERMIHIHERIKQGRFPNCKRLSEETEMSKAGHLTEPAIASRFTDLCQLASAEKGGGRTRYQFLGVPKTGMAPISQACDSAWQRAALRVPE